MLGLMAQMVDAGATPPGFGNFDDFLNVDDLVTLTGKWTITTAGSGAAGITSTPLNGGTIRISGQATTDATGSQIQGVACHAVTASKRMVYKCRARLNTDASESNMFAGLAVIDTSLAASLPTDGFWFNKPDGGTTINCSSRCASGTATTVTPAAAAFTMDTSWHTYGIGVFVNGDATSGTVEFAIDGVNVARQTLTLLPLTTIIMAPSFAFLSGNATSTHTCDVDYVGHYQDR